MSITDKEIQHVAKLSRIALTEDELSKLGQDVVKILEYIGKLNEMATEGVDLNLTELRPTNQLREDHSADSGIQEEILSQAPRRKGDYYQVKAVLED